MGEQGCGSAFLIYKSGSWSWKYWFWSWSGKYRSGSSSRKYRPVSWLGKFRFGSWSEDTDLDPNCEKNRSWFLFEKNSDFDPDLQNEELILGQEDTDLNLH